MKEALLLPSPVSFGPFRLDAAGTRLSRGEEAVQLPPKALATLAYLVAHRGRLVGKDELLDAVWGRHFISEGVLKNAVQTLRQALNDDARAPTFIETQHRLGYRFIAEVREETTASAPLSPPAGTRPLVGREDALSLLNQLVDGARRGEPQLAFVTGEPGIGKTSLIDTFLLQAGLPAARGQCIEQYGQVEPYLPVLEAINALGRHDAARLAALLRQVAPTWLAQLPWLLNEADRTHLVYEVQGSTQLRMLREFGEFLERWTAEKPLILVLEDLHWSDHATASLLGYLARCGRPGRWLVLGSYRPAEVATGDHPLAGLKRELMAQGLCREVALPLLSPAAVGEYLQQRFPGLTISSHLAGALHARTEGLPFFMAQLAEDLVGQGDFSEERLLSALPEGLQYLIEQQFQRLSADQQRLLAAASVAGVSFSVEAVAAALGRPLDETEGSCEALARLRHFLCPQGTLRGRMSYGFSHAFYHQFVYSSLTASHRADLHLRIGQWLEASCGDEAEETAAELALHFEQGRDYDRAARHLQRAAEHAARRHAPQEAVSLLRRGLALVEQHLPRNQDSSRLAADMYGALAPALFATRGPGAAELEPVYERLFEYTRQFGATLPPMPVLWGKWTFHFTRTEFGTAVDCAQALLDEGQRTDDSDWLIAGNHAMGTGLWFRGDFASSEMHFQRVLALYDPARHRHLAMLVGEDLGVVSRVCYALALWQMGRPEQATKTLDEALALADTLGHHFTRCAALVSAAWLHVDRREPKRAIEYCNIVEPITVEYGFEFFRAMLIVMRGWSLADLGETELGIAEHHRGLEVLAATGTAIFRPLYGSLLADIYRMTGRYGEGLAVVADALERVRLTDERFYEPRLHRMRGELLQADPAAEKEAEACFQQAIACARTQGARALELQAATSLGHLWLRQGRREQARKLVSGVLAAFTEGFDTPDLLAAKELIERC